MRGFFGPEGTFTHQALLTLGNGPAVAFPTVARALDAVRSGDVSASLVPIENSVEGGVTATLDYLAHRLRNDHDTMEDPNRLTWLFRGHKNWTAAECGQLVLATQSMFGFGAS